MKKKTELYRTDWNGVLSSRKVDGTEREGDDIVLNRDDRGRLILKCWNGMVVVTVVCEDRGHQTHTTEHGESV